MDSRELEAWIVDWGLERINADLIQEAFTHPSYKGMDPSARDYERLEFLGDAVLDLITTETLIREGGKSEGVMTELRRGMVSNSILAEICDKLEIAPLVRAQEKYHLTVKDRANVVEALFGAIFLTAGYTVSLEFWKKVWNLTKNIGLEIRSRIPEHPKFDKQSIWSPKNILQEYTQEHGLPFPEYVEISRDGPDHNPTFTVEVTARVDNDSVEVIKVSAKGKTKKEAEIRAARKVLEQLKGQD